MEVQLHVDVRILRPYSDHENKIREILRRGLPANPAHGFNNLEPLVLTAASLIAVDEYISIQSVWFHTLPLERCNLIGLQVFCSWNKNVYCRETQPLSAQLTHHMEVQCKCSVPNGLAARGLFTDRKNDVHELFMARSIKTARVTRIRSLPLPILN